MQSVVRVDPTEVHEWVSSLLQDQDAGKTEQLSYSPDNTTVEVVNGTDINGLAAAVSQVLTNKGFQPGATGNHEGAPPASSQVLAAKRDDLGAQAVSKDLGGLPVNEDSTLPPGAVRVVLAADYTGPGSDGMDPSAVGPASVDDTYSDTGESSPPPPPSPILTAGSDDPKCVN